MVCRSVVASKHSTRSNKEVLEKEESDPNIKINKKLSSVNSGDSGRTSALLFEGFEAAEASTSGLKSLLHLDQDVVLVADMTYNVSSGTSSIYSLTHSQDAAREDIEDDSASEDSGYASVGELERNEVTENIDVEKDLIGLLIIIVFFYANKAVQNKSTMEKHIKRRRRSDYEVIFDVSSRRTKNKIVSSNKTNELLNYFAKLLVKLNICTGSRGLQESLKTTSELIASYINDSSSTGLQLSTTSDARYLTLLLLAVLLYLSLTDGKDFHKESDGGSNSDYDLSNCRKTDIGKVFKARAEDVSYIRDTSAVDETGVEDFVELNDDNNDNSKTRHSDIDSQTETDVTPCAQSSQERCCSTELAPDLEEEENNSVSSSLSEETRPKTGDMMTETTVTTTPTAPSEMVELILLSSSWLMIRRLWNSNNEDAVGNTYRLLSTVCHDWWSQLRQPLVRRTLRSALRSTDFFVFYRPRASFVQQLKSNMDVNGVAICDQRVFVIGISSSAIEVFDATSYLQLQTLTVHAMTDPWDIAASPTSSSLYVFEGLHQILRLDLNGSIATSWMLDGSQRALSVSVRNSVVITYSDRLEEFDNVGRILRSISLDRTISSASHSQGLNADMFAVCHGSGRCSVSHLVCLVDSVGRIMQHYRDSGGSIYQPLHLAVADHGCIMAADIHNQRVQILNENLRQSYDLISTREQNCWPLKMCYDSPRGNVYICTLDGKVLVYRVRTRTSPHTECLDVHSGLIPGHLTDTDHDSSEKMHGYELGEE